MSEIIAHVSAAVRELLGPARTERIVRVPAARPCVICERPVGTGTGRVNAVVLTEGVTLYTVYAHPGCADSAVAPVDGIAAAAADSLTMRVVPMYIPYGGGDLPTLAVEMDGGVYSGDTGGDLVDVLVSLLLGAGCDLVAGVDRIPDGLLPDRWCVYLLPDDRVVILDGDGESFFDGWPPLPDEWAEIALDLGGCLLFGGPSGAADAPGEAARVDALRAAASAGLLAGCRVPVRDQRAG